MKAPRSRSDAHLYHPETGELLQGLQRSLLSNDGRLEYPDPVPMEPPVSSMRPVAGGMRALVQELIREEMSQLADAMEMETFEEADDFEIEDDPLDPLTPYEKVFDPKDAEKAPVTKGSGVVGGVPEAPPSTSSESPLGGAEKPADAVKSNGVSNVVPPAS